MWKRSAPLKICVWPWQTKVCSMNWNEVKEISVRSGWHVSHSPLCHSVALVRTRLPLMNQVKFGFGAKIWIKSLVSAIRWKEKLQRRWVSWKIKKYHKFLLAKTSQWLWQGKFRAKLANRCNRWRRRIWSQLCLIDHNKQLKKWVL